MAISLYDISVASYIQTLTAVTGFLDKGLAHCTEAGLDPAEIVEARIHRDMLPLSFQVLSVAHHSIGAIEGIRKGRFGPPGETPPLDCAGLRKVVADAREALLNLDRAEVDSLEGRDVVFEFRDFKLPFTAEGFIASFSLPNFYFHAATAYDILRARGAPLGKRDFMGPPRLKT